MASVWLDRTFVVEGLVRNVRTPAVVVVCLMLTSCALPMGLRHNSLVDGNSITYVHRSGSSPTVVFESGLGDGLSSWGNVYDAVGEFAGVFAYSRPGYSPGLSTVRVDSARTAQDAAGLLQTLLSRNGARPPYVLVGHSIGGLYVMEFARAYPDLVAGLVIVDGRIPGFTQACEAAGLSPCLPPATSALLAPPHIAAEIRGIEVSEESAPSPHELRMPAILLVATEAPPGAPADAQPIWLHVQKEFANALPKGSFRLAEGAGHYIQKDSPELVIESIRKLVRP